MAKLAETDSKDPVLSQGAHEIRNLIAPILGYVRMLASERLGPLTEHQRKVVDLMVSPAGKIANLGKEMSLLSLLVAGGAQFNRVRVELRPLIDGEVLKVLAVPDGDREIAIRLIDEADGVTVNGDPEWLRPAFHALLAGHRREAATTDELCVALERATLDGRPAVRFTFGGSDVIDMLRGLAPSDLSPFVEYRGGVGFGLAIAREVVRAEGGQLFSKITPPVPPSISPIVHGSVVVLPLA
jgi:signal transduction histidine kinase